MPTSLRETVFESLDFSPAGASLENSVLEYRAVLEGAQTDVVSRFRCPINRLEELGAVFASQRPGEILGLCATAGEIEPWNDLRFKDAGLLNQFQSRFEAQAEIGMVSFSIPQTGSIQSYLDDLKGFSSADVEVVVVAGSEGAEDVIGFASEREWIEIGLQGSGQELAQAIVQCVGLEIPFRVLSVGATAFSGNGSIGIVNALAASMFAYSDELAAGAVTKILEAQENQGWKITAKTLGFEDLVLDLEQIEEARSLVAGVSVSSLRRASEALASIKGF